MNGRDTYKLTSLTLVDVLVMRVIDGVEGV